MSLTLESLLLNGRASERGIRRLLRSIPYEDSKFFLCFTLVTVRQKHVSLFLHRSQNLPSLLFNVNFIISTLRLFYLKAGAKLRGGEKPCNKVCCYIDGWLPENSELMLKPLNSWMGLLEKHNIAIILLSYRLSNMNLCRFVYSEDDNSTEKTIFPFF